MLNRPGRGLCKLPDLVAGVIRVTTLRATDVTVTLYAPDRETALLAEHHDAGCRSARPASGVSFTWTLEL